MITSEEFVAERLSSVYRLKKVKCTLVQALRLCTDRTAHRGSRDIALLFLDHGTRRGEGSASRPGRSLPPGKARYSLYRRLGGPQRRSGQVRKISPTPGFDPRTVQPVASRYTDYATTPSVYSPEAKFWRPQIERQSRGTNSCFTMADSTEQGTEKHVTRYDKWLSYGGNYVEMQWDSRTINPLKTKRMLH